MCRPKPLHRARALCADPRRQNPRCLQKWHGQVLCSTCFTARARCADPCRPNPRCLPLPFFKRVCRCAVCRPKPLHRARALCADPRRQNPRCLQKWHGQVLCSTCFTARARCADPCRPHPRCLPLPFFKRVCRCAVCRPKPLHRARALCADPRRQNPRCLQKWHGQVLCSTCFTARARCADPCRPNPRCLPLPFFKRVCRCAVCRPKPLHRARALCADPRRQNPRCLQKWHGQVLCSTCFTARARCADPCRPNPRCLPLPFFKRVCRCAVCRPKPLHRARALCADPHRQNPRCLQKWHGQVLCSALRRPFPKSTLLTLGCKGLLRNKKVFFLKRPSNYSAGLARVNSTSGPSATPQKRSIFRPVGWVETFGPLM